MLAMRRRWAALAALAGAALAAHLLAFSGLGWLWPQRETHGSARPVQVRVVEAEAGAPSAPVPVPTPTAVETPARAPAPVAVRSRTPRSIAAPGAAPTPVATRAVVPPAPLPEPAPDAVPRYRTQLPPAVTLRYVMQRGALRGIGELSWRPTGDHYGLMLTGAVSGLTVLTQVSAGGFDAAGIAPLRFTDQRLRRGTRAANFLRDAGKVTFSGPSVEFALHEGEQDRLSWMIQLGAIVAAEPSLRVAGARVVMHVVGANGDPSVWVFDGAGVETVSTGTGAVDALKFVREPREPYDTRVQVWLDPARHHLPVQASQQSGSGDEPFELRLQSFAEHP